MNAVCYPKPLLLDTLHTQPHVVIEASAGTGKTYLIEHLVVDLLLTQQAPLDSILVVTFTEKATTELKLRIRAMLTGLLVARQESVAPETPHWLLDDTARQLLQQALQAFGSAPISTMHGFCQRVLSDYAFHHQSLFQDVLSTSALLAQRAFTLALRHDFTRQQPAVLRTWLETGHSLADLQELLVESSQKRLPLHPRFDALALQRCIQQGNALLTTSPDVLARLQEEITAGKGHAGTKNAMLKRLAQMVAIFQQPALAENLLRFLQQCDGPLLQDILESYEKLVARGFQVSAAALLPQVLHFLQTLRGLCVPFKTAVAQVLSGSMQHRFTEEKQRHGVIDFDDMIHLVWTALQDAGAHGHALRSALRQRYRYAIIDEFQDTDAVQWQIFRHLFMESPEQHRLFVVADPKQAIYAFRGADVTAYHAARQALASDAPLALTTNYRSTAPLIACLNTIFATDTDAPLWTGKQRLSAEVFCGRPHVRLHDAAGQESSPLCLVQLRRGTHAWNATTLRRLWGGWIAAEIRRLLAAPLWLDDPPVRQRIQAGDMFILCRSQAEAQEIAHYLRAVDIPYVFPAQDSLWQSREAAAMYDVLQAVAMPHDAARCLRAWLTPFFAVPLESLPLYKHVPASHPLRQRLAEWHALAMRRDYAALFARLLYDSGLMQRTLLLEQHTGVLTNYQHLSEVLLEEASRTPGTLTDLLYTFKACMEQRQVLPGAESTRQDNAERQAVQVMTIHKSKGLEAAVVFFYGGFSAPQGRDVYMYHTPQGERVLTLGYDDTARHIAQQEQVEEEQRLLYVALTRARARLYLPYIAPAEYEARWRGCQRLLNTRLSVLLQDAQFAAGLCMTEVTAIAPPQSSFLADGVWQPPAHLLAAVNADAIVPWDQPSAGMLPSSHHGKQAASGDHVSCTAPPNVHEAAAPHELPESARVRSLAIPQPFSPLGTARQLFLGHTPFQEARASALLDTLHRAAEQHEEGRNALLLAWELSRYQEGLSLSEYQALLLLLLASLLTMRQGSTRMPVLGDAGRAHLEETLGAFLGGRSRIQPWRQYLDVIDSLLLSRRVPRLIGTPGASTPLLLVAPYLYHHKLWHQEERFIEGLLRLTSQRLPAWQHAPHALEALRQCPPHIGGLPRPLSAEQEDAVLTALRAPVTVITGGPGTGKTTIVFSLLRCLVRLGVPLKSIALAAPTGKAAQRLGTSLQQALLALPQRDAADAALGTAPPVPQTLHRLLGYTPVQERFLHHTQNPLPHSVVIVDESSMIDLFLMQSLVNALGDQARLILLGDAEQLPAVEAGAVLRDLLPCESAPATILRQGPAVVRLRTSHRMRAEDHAGRALLSVAGHINNGSTTGLFVDSASTEPGILLRSTMAEVTFSRVEMVSPATEPDLLAQFCQRWWRECIASLADFEALSQTVYRYETTGFAEADRARLQRLSQHLESARILCLTRRHATGTEALHAHLQALWAGMPSASSAWLPGMPVMMLHNDYDRQIFNGDQGLLVQVALAEKPPTLMAVFCSAGQWQAFPLDSLRQQLTLALAVTVHKSQGSEFDRVAIILPQHDLPLLSREMLYTALTRSRHSVTIIGHTELFMKGVARTMQRFSGIAEKLSSRDVVVC